MYLPNRCALGTNIRHPGVLFAASSISTALRSALD